MQTATPLWPERDTNHNWHGVRISMVRPGDSLYALGLRDRDLLRSANGISAVAALRDPMVLAPLKGTQNLRLDITRGRTTRTLVYKIVP